VTLNNPLNNFGGAVSVGQADLGVTLDDANTITLGTVNTLADLNVTAGGTIDLAGTESVGGKVSLLTAGAVTQSAGSLTATGVEFQAGGRGPLSARAETTCVPWRDRPEAASRWSIRPLVHRHCRVAYRTDDGRAGSNYSHG